MATPALCALLWLGALPSVRVVLLGLLTTFAGYTAVYALNDIMDYRTDREKVRDGGFGDVDNYLDAVLVRHPMAYGLLSFKQGLVWAMAWTVVALVGAYLLNPVCVAVFLAGCVLEMVYCAMLKISHLRILVSGGVKTSGAIAGVFAVDPSPSVSFLACLFLWLFFWEMGGQNIPADWTDVEEDRRAGAKTIPVLLGAHRAVVFILCSLMAAITLGITVFILSRTPLEPPYAAAVVGVGIYLLLIPALRLLKTRQRPQAMALFNKASYYPLALLVVVGVRLMVS